MKILACGFQRILFVLLIIIMACANQGKVYAASTVNEQKSAEMEDDLFDLTLEELLQIKVTSVGTLSELETNKLPFSYHLITAKDIANAPHRNFFDIIATYVPDAMVSHHLTGDKLGIRGIIGDRNYKMLILINGRNVTDKAKTGLVHFMDNWDTNDIDKVEVISGPGAVTYGPGAIAGVISITTKTSENTEGTRVGLIAHPTYNGSGVFLEHAFKNAASDFGLYAYMSVVRTEGDKNADFYWPDPNKNSQYVGHDDSYSGVAEHHRADTFDEPQIKLHLDMTFGDSWRWWIRYTDAGVSAPGTKHKQEFADGLLDNRGENIETLATALTHKMELDEGAKLNTTFSFDSHSYTNLVGSKPSTGDADDPIHRNFGYEESEFFVQTIYSTKVLNDTLTYAVGSEASIETINAPFGEREETLFLGDGISLISGPNSVYYNENSSKQALVGSGISFNTYAVFGEGTYQLNDTYTLMAAARYDMHEYTDSLLSPRLAVVAEHDKNIYKLIAQSSSRRTSTALLYAADKFGLTADPEKIFNAEFIYSRLESESLRFDMSVFYSDLEIIGWSGSGVLGESSTKSIGDLQLWGISLELNYQHENLNIVLNHSFTQEYDFELAKDFKGKQGISFSDYNHDKDNLEYRDYGSDINNWSTHITKASIDYKINHWTFHANAQLYWGYQGIENELGVFDQAYANLSPDLTQEQRDEVAANQVDYEKIKEDINSKDPFGLNPIVNLSVSRAFGENGNVDVWLGVRNVFGNYISHSISTGSQKTYPIRVRWMEEPLSTYLRVTARF